MKREIRTKQHAYYSDKTPEQQLIIAMLKRALLDLALEDEYRRSSWRWINSDSWGVFSFNWCCEQLDEEPSVMRKRVKTPLEYE